MSFLSLFVRYWYFVAIGILCAALGAQTMRMNHARTQVYKIERERADSARIASEAARAEEARRQSELNEVATNARIQITAAQADAALADAAADRLRHDLAAFVGRSRKGATVAIGSPPAADPIGVLALMYSSADAEAGEVASFADASRIAGNACVAAYEALTK